MVGAMSIQLDFAWGFQKGMILGRLSELNSLIGHQSELVIITLEDEENDNDEDDTVDSHNNDDEVSLAVSGLSRTIIFSPGVGCVDKDLAQI